MREMMNFVSVAFMYTACRMGYAWSKPVPSDSQARVDTASELNREYGGFSIQIVVEGRYGRGKVPFFGMPWDAIGRLYTFRYGR